MTLSKELKALVSKFCDLEGLSQYSEIKEVINAVLDMDGESDKVIEINCTDYRVIHEDEIDQIMQEELESDPYVLGCCSTWLISDIMGIPQDAVRKIQDAKCFEALGIILSSKYLEEVQQEIVRHDGYGHHFNCWDGSEEQVGPFYIFRR